MEAVIFDCDGMLVDSDRVSDRLMADGAPIEEIKQFFSDPFQRCVIGAADLKEELALVKRSWGWKGSVEELCAYWFSPAHNRIDQRYAEIINSLRVRGVRAFVATNNEKYRTRNLIQERGLGAWFDDSFSSSTLGSKKPEARFYDEIISRIGVPAEEIFYFDDDPGNIKGALACGLDARLHTDFESFQRIMASL